MSGLASSLPSDFVRPKHAGLCRRVGGEVGVAFLAGDRRVVDDATVILRLHRGDHDLVHIERAVEIDLDHLAPFVRIIVLERRIVARPHRAELTRIDTGPTSASVSAWTRFSPSRSVMSTFLARGSLALVLRSRVASASVLRSHRLTLAPEADQPPGNGEADALRTAGDLTAVWPLRSMLFMRRAPQTVMMQPVGP